LTLVLDITTSVVDIVSVSDEGSFHGFACFKIDSMASFDDVFKTMSESITKSVRDKQVSDRVLNVVVRDEKEH
jgi:hypothetical protein